MAEPLSPCLERLLRRAGAPAGAIDVRRMQRQVLARRLWVERHFPLLARLLARVPAEPADAVAQAPLALPVFDAGASWPDGLSQRTPLPGNGAAAPASMPARLRDEPPAAPPGTLRIRRAPLPMPEMASARSGVHKVTRDSAQGAAHPADADADAPVATPRSAVRAEPTPALSPALQRPGATVARSEAGAVAKPMPASRPAPVQGNVAASTDLPLRGLPPPRLAAAGRTHIDTVAAVATVATVARGDAAGALAAATAMRLDRPWTAHAAPVPHPLPAQPESRQRAIPTGLPLVRAAALNTPSSTRSFNIPAPAAAARTASPAAPPEPAFVPHPAFPNPAASFGGRQPISPTAAAARALPATPAEAGIAPSSAATVPLPDRRTARLHPRDWDRLLDRLSRRLFHELALELERRGMSRWR